MHLNGIAKRITALALGAALLTATALPAFAEGTQQINVKYTYNAIDGTTWATAKSAPMCRVPAPRTTATAVSPTAMLPRPMVIGSISAPCTAAWAQA